MGSIIIGLNAGYLNTGGRFNPDTGIWTATSISGAPSGRRSHAAIWSDSEMIIFGGSNNVNDLNSFGIYYPANTYTISGNLTGLNGNQVILQNNAGDDLTLTADGDFTFNRVIIEGADYAVSVLTDPINPFQTCSVSNGSGTNIMADVTNVQVTCTTNQYNVGVTVTGLGGVSVVLQNNYGDDLTISSNAVLSNFATALDDLSAYAVTVLTNPNSPNQTCLVAGGTNSDGTGAITGNHEVTITLTCTTNQFFVGGMTSGLVTGNPVILNLGVENINVDG